MKEISQEYLGRVGCNGYKVPAALDAVLSQELEGRVVCQPHFLSHNCEKSPTCYLRIYVCLCVCVCVCVSALDVKVRNGGVGSDVSHDRERKMN